MKKAFPLLIACVAFPTLLHAQSDQGGLEFDQRMNGSVILGMMEPLRSKIQNSSAVIYDGQEVVAYGVLMSPMGDVLTKASELSPDKAYTVRLGETVYENVTVKVTDHDCDVALIRLGIQNAFVPEQANELPSIGTIVVSNGATSRKRRRIKLGIISANSRSIPQKAERIPYIGLSFAPPNLIAEVVPDSPADTAGLQTDDKILKMDATDVVDLNGLGQVLQSKKPGDTLKIQVERKGVVSEIDLVLASKAQFVTSNAGGQSKEDQGFVSGRSDDFQLVLQHDTPLTTNGMGGPVFDLDGRLIGMNIARVNRAETFALPVAVMNEVYTKLIHKLQ